MKYVSWVEKNRPSKLNEICYQEEVKEGLRNFINNKNIPHLLFFGPSGSGKTSTIIAFAKEIFGIGLNLNIEHLETIGSIIL
jgi:DNA polymerase III delta prime subunit